MVFYDSVSLLTIYWTAAFRFHSISSGKLQSGTKRNGTVQRTSSNTSAVTLTQMFAKWKLRNHNSNFKTIMFLHKLITFLLCLHWKEFISLFIYLFSQIKTATRKNAPATLIINRRTERWRIRETNKALRVAMPWSGLIAHSHGTIQNKR